MPLANNDIQRLYSLFPQLEPLSPEAETLLTPLIEECTSYSDLLLRIADMRLERKLSFGTLLQLLFCVQVEQTKVFIDPR